MNYISPSYKSAMDAPIRRMDVGANQGRGDPPASRYHHEAAEVARIKSSTPLPDLPITMEDSSPLANWRFWVGGAVSVLIWTALCYGVYWVRS